MVASWGVGLAGVGQAGRHTGKGVVRLVVAGLRVWRLRGVSGGQPVPTWTVGLGRVGSQAGRQVGREKGVA